MKACLCLKYLSVMKTVIVCMGQTHLHSRFLFQNMITCTCVLIIDFFPLSIVGSASIILSVLLTGKLNAAEVMFMYGVKDMNGIKCLWCSGTVRLRSIQCLLNCGAFVVCGLDQRTFE